MNSNELLRKARKNQMKYFIEKNHPTYRPDENGVFTVRDLIEILQKCPPNAEILVGTGLDNCEEYIERVIVSGSNILFATESSDDENPALPPPPHVMTREEIRETVSGIVGEIAALFGDNPN